MGEDNQGKIGGILVWLPLAEEHETEIKVQEVYLRGGPGEVRQGRRAKKMSVTSRLTPPGGSANPSASAFRVWWGLVLGLPHWQHMETRAEPWDKSVLAAGGGKAVCANGERTRGSKKGSDSICHEGQQ